MDIFYVRIENTVITIYCYIALTYFSHRRVDSTLQMAKNNRNVFLMIFNIQHIQIGWSKLSTKIVIFATDGLIHFAGDGLLAGVIKKNDQVCKLSPSGEYLAALESDYPSLEEIYRALQRHKVDILSINISIYL